MSIIQLDVTGLEEKKAKEIKALYSPMIIMLEEMEGQYNEIVSRPISPELISDAKRLRIDIAQVRIQADKARKLAKEEYLRAGNAIQGAYNTLLYAVKSKEEKLEEIELFFENQEKERKAKIKSERTLILEGLGANYIPNDIGEMDNEIWESLRYGFEQKQKEKLELEKRLEEERKENEKLDKIEQERWEMVLPYKQFHVVQRNELRLMQNDVFDGLMNDLLNRKKEYDLKVENNRKEAKRLRKEAEKKRIKDEEEAKKRAEQAAEEKAKQDAILKKEREEKERLEKELKERDQAEAKRIAEIEEKEQLEAGRGDEDKVINLMNDLEALRNKYYFKSKANKEMYRKLGLLLEKSIQFIIDNKK